MSADTVPSHVTLAAATETSRLAGFDIPRTELEDAFRALFEHAEEAVFFLRVEGPERFVYERVNQRLADIVGIPREAFVGRAPEEIYSPASAEQMRADNLACLRAGGPITHEREFALPEGARAVRITLIPSRDAGGRVVRIIGLTTDITVLRRQQRLYAESELIAGVGGWELDCANERLLWTPGTFRIFEREPQSFVPTVENAVTLYEEDFRPVVRQALARARREGGQLEFHATARLDSGRRIHVRVLAQAVVVEGRVARIVGGVQDVTAQEEATEQRLRLEAQLRRAQKMEAVGTLAGGIAHDFNNILAGIMGNAQLAALDLPAESPARRFLDNTHQGCLRARDLVRRILAFSRRTEQPRSVAPLRPIVEEALELLRASLPASVAITTRFPAEELHVLADSGQVHQVLLNLGTNAAHAMRPLGGTLFVELARCAENEERRRRHPQLRPEHRVRLTVSDTGHGIPPEALERIFEPFYTTKAIGEGSGLGLAMVHGIVENHGGAIVVESEPGRGSAFHVFLPEQPCPSGNAGLRRAEAAAPAGGGRLILVVDDEPSITELVEPMLRHLGYRAAVRNDPREALALFASAPADYAALLCDLTMPGLDGLAFARSAQALRPGLPVLLMTGYLRPAELRPMLDSGIRHHLAKPFSMATLAARLGEALGASSPGNA